MKKDNVIKYGIISVFVSLYLIVSTISMIHSIDFFGLSNSNGMALALATAFEIGQVAALCGILILDKTNRFVIWSLFLLLTSMQVMSNVYFSYKYLGDYSTWAELFGLGEEEPIFQKRMLAIISGGILPIVALGFIKSLVDYLRPAAEEEIKVDANPREDKIVTITETEEEPEVLSDKFDSTINISDELAPVKDESVKEVMTRKVEMPRTPAQYYRDPITGGGAIKNKGK